MANNKHYNKHNQNRNSYRSNNNIRKITAPYNFVPLNKEIFYPEWSNVFKDNRNGKKIHDFPVHNVPFQDGESGEIGIEITSHSPIFIRNHYQGSEDCYTMTKEGKEVKISKEFCYAKEENGAKRFYIPASSIKGMIRNIVEIMSFSRIKIDKDKHSKIMSVRDMTNRAKLVGTARDCGFLIEDNGQYFIEKCDKILTIDHFHLENEGINTKQMATAEEKYKKYHFKKVSYSTYKKIMDVRGKKIPKLMAKIDNKSSQKGLLVFTGDINNKKHEFVFSLNTKKIKINKVVVENFKKVYFENENSIDGQYWKEQWQARKKIPIFYFENNGKIHAIGLTQLFKLAYGKTIYQAAKQNFQSEKLDLAETIFGTEKENSALKGRVYFSHLKSNIERYEANNEIEQVLGSPNPSYYPNYIEQTDIEGQKVRRHITLMDKDATIRGFKRYPLQSEIQHYELPKDKDKQINHDVTTKFKPLQKGVKFSGKLRFHNLKKEELGAILSALTFHGQNDKYFHNIGMAKPLGYGKIKIDLNFNKPLKCNQEEYLKAFEDMMNSWEDKEYDSWKSSLQLTELFSMSDKNKAKSLRYQQLERIVGKNRDGKDITKNDFVEDKKAKEFLLPHSGKLIKNNIKHINTNGEAFNNPFGVLKGKGQ